MRRPFLASLLAFSMVWGSDHLQQQDVPPVMEQLVKHHLTQRQMTPQLLRRSYEIYLDQFDPYRIYLTEEEVAPYLNPKQDQLNAAWERYQGGNLADYGALDYMIQKGIARARRWRRPLANEVRQRVMEGRLETTPLVLQPRFAANEEELYERQRKQMALSVRQRLSHEKKASLNDALSRAWSDYNKGIERFENPYLYRDYKGIPLRYQDQDHALATRSLKALAQALDAHTAFLGRREAEQMRAHLTQGITGIGVVFKEGSEGPVVVKLIPGGPADESGRIQVNDILVSVNGVAVDGESLSEIIGKLHGEKGEPLSLIVKRNDGQEVEVELMRAPIRIDGAAIEVQSYPFDGGLIGVIRLTTFFKGKIETSSDAVRKAIRDLKKQGRLEGVVLDLRDNLGGFLDQAIEIAGLFITNGVIAVAQYSDGEEVYFRDTDGHAYFTGPLVILTSRASASAAEIVTAALQDYGRAIVVGDPTTFGKGTIQHQTVTNDDAETYYKVTVGRYYTPSGVSTQLVGVSSDIIVPTMLFDEEVGEQYLSHPIAADEISPFFEEELNDLKPAVKRWMTFYYLPTRQKPIQKWAPHLAYLRRQSWERIYSSPEYQDFIEEMTEDNLLKEAGYLPFEVLRQRYSLEDLQLEEAILILEDMIVIDRDIARN